MSVQGWGGTSADGASRAMPDSRAAVTGEKESSVEAIIICRWRRASQVKAAPATSEKAFTNRASTKVQQLFNRGGASGSRTPGSAHGWYARLPSSP